MVNENNKTKMEIKFNVNDVLPCMAQVASIVNPKNAIPILSNLLLETKRFGDSWYLRITSCDSEMWLTGHAILKECDEEFSFCINSSDFISALRNLSDAVVDITVNDTKKTISCNYGVGNFILPFENGLDFPRTSIKVDNDGHNLQIKEDTFAYCVEKTSIATGNSDLRPVLNGIRFDFTSDNSYVAASTDGQKLIKIEIGDIRPNLESFGFTLPKKVQIVLKGILAKNSPDNISISFDDRCCVIRNKLFTITTRLMEGNYPKYNSVIPTDNDIELKLGKQDVWGAIKRVMPMGNATSNLVVLKIWNNNVTIIAEDMDFGKSAKEDIGCEYNDNELTIGFNGVVLCDMIQNINCDNVVFLLKEPFRPCLIRPEETATGVNYTSLLMPMQLQTL